MSRLQQQEGMNDPGRISKVTLEYLNQRLLQYPDESRQKASEIVSGFHEAIDDIEDINMDDMDEAYNMLYQNLMTMPTFQGIQSRLAAITLAKFFLEKFQYLPTPSIPLIQTNETNNASTPSANSRPSSVDSNDVARVRANPSPASTNVAQIHSMQSSPHANHIDSTQQHHYVSSIQNDVTRNIATNNLAVAAIHNHAAMNSSLNQSVPTNLSEAEYLYRQRLQNVQNARQMVAANAAASSGIQFSPSNPSLQMVHGVSSNRMQAMPQQLTVYGPNGQPGVQTNLTSVMSASAGVPHAPPTYRHILPRTQISAPTAQSNPARHNLPPQVHPSRQPYR